MHYIPHHLVYLQRFNHASMHVASARLAYAFTASQLVFTRARSHLSVNYVCTTSDKGGLNPLFRISSTAYSGPLFLNSKLRIHVLFRNLLLRSTISLSPKSPIKYLQSRFSKPLQSSIYYSCEGEGCNT